MYGMDKKKKKKMMYGGMARKKKMYGGMMKKRKGMNAGGIASAMEVQKPN